MMSSQMAGNATNAVVPPAIAAVVARVSIWSAANQTASAAVAPTIRAVAKAAREPAGDSAESWSTVLPSIRRAES
jgi:hypothetical protein